MVRQLPRDRQVPFGVAVEEFQLPAKHAAALPDDKKLRFEPIEHGFSHSTKEPLIPVFRRSVEYAYFAPRAQRNPRK